LTEVANWQNSYVVQRNVFRAHHYTTQKGLNSIQ
jgi:hypothetical protein